MGIRESQKVDLSSQVTVGGNVHVSEEQRVGISRTYAGSDVALSRLLLSSCQYLIPRLYLFGGIPAKRYSSKERKGQNLDLVSFTRQRCTSETLIRETSF